MVLDLSNEKYLKTLDNKHQVTPLMTQQKFANRFRARKGGKVGGGFLSKTDFLQSIKKHHQDWR